LYSKKYRSKAEQSNPLVGQNPTAEESNQAHENQRCKGKILSNDNLPFASSLRKENGQKQNVVEVSRRKCNHSGNQRGYKPIHRGEARAARLNAQRSPLPEIALGLVRFDHVASGIVNANHSVMCAAAVHCLADCIIWRIIPQPTEWQRIG